MILTLSLAALAVTAVLTPPVARRLGRATGYPLALVFAGIGVLLLTQAPTVLDGGTVTVARRWVPSLGVEFHLRLDGLSLLFVVLILGVGALIMAYCARYLDETQAHVRLYGLLTVFALSMLGLVLAADLVLFFVFWEMTTLTSFFLIGGPGLAGAKSATRALIVTGGGGLALFAGLVMIAVTTGTTDMTAILADPGLITESPLAFAIAACLILAAFTKSAQLPFHFWLPDAMVAITPVSAYLHAATMVKAGIYLLMRFSPPFADDPFWTATLVSVGLLTAVVGAVLALKQHDLKALLAYSTVSQLGFLVALVGIGTPQALAAAALHTFAHALFKATLFMLVGIIDHEAGSRDIRELSGLRRVMPVTAVLTGVAALSMAGLPPFMGFVSKEEAFYGFLGADGPAWVGWLAAGTAVGAAALTFAYGFRILAGAFGGPVRQPNLYEPRWSFLAPAAVPAVLSLVFGIWAAALNPLINRTVQDTRLQEGGADLALWHGFTAALGLSAVTITVGTTLFLLRDRVDAVLLGSRLPRTGAQLYDATYDGALRFGALVGRPALSPRLAAHLVWPLLALAVLAGVGMSTLGPLTASPEPATRAADWVLVALLGVGTAALTVARSRLGALALLGVVGFVVAAWFLVIGGPDLALTQLLVEILTVVVAVLVLRRLPARFAPGSRLRTAGAAVAAAAVGVAAFAATFALTGRRDRSAAGDFLLTESEPLTGGTNVVNTVLVDFRGLDTLGEITVLAVAAIGLLALLRYDAPTPRAGAGVADPVADPVGNAVILRVTRTLLLPVALLFSLYLLLRGHNAPGGGFISALVGGAAIALAQLPYDVPRRPRVLSPALLVGSGVALAVAVGLLGYVDGAFLRPLPFEPEVFGVSVKLTSSLLFDVGVYLVVLGLVVAAVDRLGRGRSRPEAARRPASRGDDADPAPAPAAAGAPAPARTADEHEGVAP
ncbi:hydrogen gas-evolving membrane-bound hydrogenase subunit E [Trujillonella humicola]|uniref:hydrogen gas-evolving membrane-bound hydrogenase subunit E n=1 Tax=Trujillonella humicola TaxID=3383699 RepID=UPI0039057B64